MADISNLRSCLRKQRERTEKWDGLNVVDKMQP